MLITTFLLTVKNKATHIACKTCLLTITLTVYGVQTWSVKYVVNCKDFKQRPDKDAQVGLTFTTSGTYICKDKQFFPKTSC